MRFAPPPFAGPDSPPRFAAAAAAAFGLATLAASAAAGAGPDAAERFLARGDARAALSVLAASALPCAAAFAIALAGAAANGGAPPAGPAPKGFAARLSALLRAMPRGSGASGTAVAFLLLGAFAFAPAMAMLSVPVGLALEALGVEPEPQFAAKVFALPETGPATRLALALSVTVFAPVAEEILYRAILWQGLCAALRRRFPRGVPARRADAAAAVLCAVFFATLHLSAWAFAPLALFALALSAVYRRFSLGCAIALHAGFNAGGCLLALLA